MSVIYKRTERERERDWETGSSRTGGGGYTTVRRYKIPEHSLETDTYEAEMKIVHRGSNNFDDHRSVRDFDDRRSVKDFDDRRSVKDFDDRRSVKDFDDRRSVKDFDDRRSVKDFDDRRSVKDFEIRRTTKDYTVEVQRDDQNVREVREYRYGDRSPSPRGRDVREYRMEREFERTGSPETLEEIRISRNYERDNEISRDREQPYELERYSRSTEYFRPEPLPPPPQQQSQPIIIRNEAPIIRNEAAAAPQPIIFRESAPAPQPIIFREEPQTIIIREREPAYEHFERSEVTEDRQVARPRRDRDEDYYYERRVKEIDRGGRREERSFDEREYGRDHYGEKGYYSDDDVVYIHKEKDTWGGSEVNTKRDIAAGALAGVAAGQIVRHHRKRKGEAAGGNIGNALGYGTLGAVSAVALDRFNNRDRSRSVSADRGRRNRSNSRHRSKSRVRELGALAAIAGVGALAYAAGRKNKRADTTTVIEKSHRHRSRSRRGRGRSKSVTVVETTGGRSRSRSKHRSRSRDKHEDPEHRNNRAAQVGLASAAVAGLVSRKRSKSRKREGKRSPSRVREGVPIAAAGVAGAAITGLYEKHKAKKEGREASRSKSRSRSRSRSVLSRLTGRSRSRRGSTKSEPVLVEYGGDPIYTDSAARNRSRRRHRRGSSSSSGGRHGSRSRSRSRSRARTVAETAAVAGVAGLAAHEATKRRDRKRAEKERERRREEDSAYSTGTYSPDYSPQPSNAQTNDRYFPETNYFPPPPVAPIDNNPNAPYPPYNPAEYPQEHYGPPPQGYVNAPQDDINLGNPYAPQHHQPDPYYNQQRRADDHVSAPAPSSSGNEHSFVTARGGLRPLPAHEDNHMANELADHVVTPEAASPVPSQKTVQFDLNPQGPSRVSSPDREHKSYDGHEDRRHRSHDEDEDVHRSRASRRDRKQRHRDDSPGSDASESTVDLPARFDEHRRRKPEDALADKLESVLQSLFR